MKRTEYYILLTKGKTDLQQRVQTCFSEDEAMRECNGRQAERTQEQRDQRWEYSIFALPADRTELERPSLVRRKSRLR